MTSPSNPILLREPLAGGVQVNFELSEVVCRRTSPFQDILVAETTAYGRALFLDGLVQSAAVDEALYHEALIHPAMVRHGDVRRVLVAGAGEGASLRELLRHPCVEEIVAVDLDGDMVEVAREHLHAWHQGAFEDPRVTVVIKDIQTVLAETADDSFDLVVLDVTDPIDEGPSRDLFTSTFYGEVRRVLRPEGWVVGQAGELDLDEMDLARAMEAALGEVFGWTQWRHRFVPSFHALWGFLAARATPPPALESEALRARIAAVEAAGTLSYDAANDAALLALPRVLREGLARPGVVMSATGEHRVFAYDRGDDALVEAGEDAS